MIQLADDEARLNQSQAALGEYQTAIAQAESAGDRKAESLALAHMAETQERTGDAASAAGSYERALALDAQGAAGGRFWGRRAGSCPEGQGGERSGQRGFRLVRLRAASLRRHGATDELAYACLLHAEALLGAQPSGALSAIQLKQQLQTVQEARQEVGARLGKKEAQARKDLLSEMLARAATLPASALGSVRRE